MYGKVHLDLTGLHDGSGNLDNPVFENSAGMVLRDNLGLHDSAGDLQKKKKCERVEEK